MSSYSKGAWDDEPQGIRPHLQIVARRSRYQRFVKPTMDRIVGWLLLILLAPVTLLAMALVRVYIGSPVIYRQQRVGLGGATFELYKLRTMIPDRRAPNPQRYEGPERRHTHKSESDPRIVPFGAFLRSFRIDELPQLFNVVRGDMSLVGPRPELPEIVAGYDDWQHHRHVVKPGLTGLWQIEAPAGKLMHECTDIDLEYVSRIGFGTDLSIMARTPVAMIRRHGI